MSRSRRKTAIDAITTADSDKLHKMLAHRAERRAVHQSLGTDRDPPHPRNYGNPWAGEKDGKRWFDRERWPERMRK